MNIMTIVKYKLRLGFEEEFIKAINAYNYSNSILMRLVCIINGEYLSIMEYDEIDITGDDEISGVEWLDSIEHMLEFFDGSRSDSCSGLVLASYNQIILAMRFDQTNISYKIIEGVKYFEPGSHVYYIRKLTF